MQTYFNSRPREGADHGYLKQSASGVNFNSRPREGAEFFNDAELILFDISTHGPARGPTCGWNPPVYSILFQLTAPRGGRPVTGSTEGKETTISTHGPARGPTISKWQVLARQTYFNSRPREGADMTQPVTADATQLFQLTAPRGGRRSTGWM